MLNRCLVLISFLIPVIVQAEGVPATESPASTLQAESVRLDGENKAMEKTVKELRTKVEKGEGEIEALRALRQEKAQHFLELSAERDRLTEALKKLEHERTFEKSEFERVKEQEKAAALDVQKAEQALAIRQAELSAEMANRSQAPVPATAPANISATENSADREIERVPTMIEPTAPGMAAAALTFTKKCRTFAAPARGSDVLAVKEPGVSIAKMAEGSDWIAFVESGRKNFVSKNCFR